MSTEYNAEALRPLYKPWEEPQKRRSPGKDGGPAVVEPGRRPSRTLLVNRLRHEVSMWRHNGYAGASDTTVTLLHHWFDTAHPNDFKYHFAQREAIETIIWLYEVAGYRNLSAMIGSLLADDDDPYANTLLLSIPPEEDAWARYCSKIATGGGKTKVMALAVVWSYFNSLFEPGSDLAQHFVTIAPNLIVFERLKDDFADGRIFFSDPLLPPEWKDDFNIQVVMQDEAGGGTSTGTLYLTNIHRLYERDSANARQDNSPTWAGPDVKRATALKVGEALRKRIAEHPAIMVLNDEAHHLHDPDSAWNEAIAALDTMSKERGNAGLVMQLDFTATPKHNDGTLFRHIVCDFPLGEAVDAGIVKVPVIGKSDALQEVHADSAVQRWSPHLKLGYKQYEYAYAEWEKTRKPLLFVMTEDTTAANEIATALDSDDYPLLKGRVINLHTKLKGKVKRKRQGGRDIYEFEVNEKQMSDEDLQVVRQISRELDGPDSPYRCVVSVLMLREGWDIRNVTTIVPLRPYSAQSNILAEQTLGRGLRRMTGPGDTAERVTVVEHSAFVKLYEEELGEEGLFPPTETLNGPKPISVSIFVDGHKAVDKLEIEIPQVSDAIHTVAVLENLGFDDVRAYFKKRFQPLPVLQKRSSEITFEERALFTDELIASWRIDRGLLSMGATAISVFVKELEKACRLQGTHAVLAPLVQRFIEEVLFEKAVSLYDGSIDHRMSDTDVIEHIRATFTPLILGRTVQKSQRERRNSSVRLSTWKPYQASSTPRRPCVSSEKTMFNLIPCDNDLEANFVDFCDIANDVAAFARNAGPQKLMLDYLAPNGRPALYWPDFIVRLRNGNYFLVEMKGQEDPAVPLKARAAVEWCSTASTKGQKWQYLFVPMAIFESISDFSIESLARACAPRLKSLIETRQMELPLEQTPEEIKQERAEKTMSEAGIGGLPEEIVTYIKQAVNQLAYDRKKNYPQYGSAFQPLLFPIEQLCGDILTKYMGPFVPAGYDDRRYFFDPYLEDQTQGAKFALTKNQRNLQKILVHGVNCNRIGTLLFCLDFAANWDNEAGGIWRAVKRAFSAPAFATLYKELSEINQFRGKHVAHVDEPLTDPELAEITMKQWVRSIFLLYKEAQPVTT